MADINAEKLAQSKQKLIDDFKESPMYTDQFTADDAIFTLQADVTVEEDVLNSVTKSVSKFGRLNIAVLCAGISYSSTSILETDVEQYDKVMRVNSRSGRSPPHLYQNYRNLGLMLDYIKLSWVSSTVETP